MGITEPEKSRPNHNDGVEKAQAEYPPPTFTYWDQLFLVLSIVAYIFNKIIDVVLIHTYLSGGELAWGLLTVLVVAVPQALVHLISYRWHVHDQEASTSLLVIHCCQLGIFLRLVAQFSDGRRWRRSQAETDAMLYLQQSSDVSLLLLFLGYLESAPQLLLQVYVTSSEDGWQLVQGVSAVLSLLALAWSNASYAKWMRRSRGDKLPLSGAAALIQLLWRLCLLLARVSALLCCALLLGGWLLLLLTVHWLLMTGWVLSQQTDLFPTRWEERLFNAIVGGIYCFSFFNVKETPARWRMIAFYSLVFAENITVATLFFLYWPRPSGPLYTVVLANVAAGTALGTLLMLLYYARFHPTAAVRPAGCCPPELAVTDPAGGGGDSGTLRSLKCRAATRVSVTSLRSAGGVSLTSQPEPVTSERPSPLPPAAAAGDKPFHLASELLADSGHVTRSAASLPARRTGHVMAGERRNQSAAAILQRSAVSAEADTAVLSVSGGSGRVSDIPQLDAVSEGDITLPTPADPAPASDDGGGDSTAANHSRMTSGASAPPPDYENVISVSVHRTGPGVRAWRTYSDVGDSAHDYSVVTERAGRLDDSAVTEETEPGHGGRHTYENTDNVALMIAHLEDGPAAGEGEEPPRDASLLVATIDTVERSGVSALFSSPPRRSRSTDDLAAAPAPAQTSAAAARRKLLNTSFDPGLLVAPPSDSFGDYKCPRSPPEAIYARPTRARDRAAAGAGAPGSRAGPRGPRGEAARVGPWPAGPPGGSQVQGVREGGHRPARPPLAAATNTPAAASPRRKFSVLRSRFESAGRRYVVTPAEAGAGAGAAVSRRPSLQAAARALWTSRGRRPDKENEPPPPPPAAVSPIDL